MVDASRAIENAPIIEGIFGGWPSFHDAEIQRITITPEWMEVAIHHWLLTDEIDPKGFYVRTHHTLSTFRFWRVSELKLGGFMSQNVLLDLEIAEGLGEPRFEVGMPSSVGCDASFKCERIEVVSAQPFSPV